MAVLNFSNNFSQKDWYKFGMAKNGCSKFFQQFFPKTAINLEWPKMAVLNFFPIIFPQTDCYQFGMAKNGSSKFF